MVSSVNIYLRKCLFLLICSALFLCLFLPSLSGQVFFQFEQAHKIKAKKYTEGDKITFRTEQFGEVWLSDKIIQIIPADNALIFYDRITYLDELTYFQYRRPWAQVTGTNLMRFGGSWLIFGGAIEGLRRIEAIDTEYEFGTDTAIIGLSSILSGYLINKLWGRAIKKINSKNRVRIIDVRF